TGVTGIGLGLARQTSRPWVRRLAPLAGLAGAIALHSLWNAGASAGLAFFAVYVVIMMPALLALLVTAGIALMFEGKIIRTQLAGEAAAGLFSADEFDRLCSVRGRLHASVSAFRQGGIRGWRARKAYHHAASELAFLRRRAQHDRVAADPVQEAGYLRALGAPEPAPAAPAPTASPDVTPVQPGP
ncbi:MAG: PrsW family glutamic-type intramembrane protease, partial [Acidobacteria bacterium]|nr:PrsW family glutamic-type intramembrane protease [Acidobacteriota bacterium]